MSRVLGIDPGIKGGLSVLSSDTILDYRPMLVTGGEIDLGEFADYCRVFDPTIAVMEKVHAMPAQGTVSMFNFGQGYGGIRGVRTALALSSSRRATSSA